MTIDPSELAADLPPSHDGEPTSLRQDILDELADHLQCATHQEMLAGHQPQEALAQALARFGNPSVVARQLWFDWMKGTLMQQKLAYFFMGVMTVLCCLLAVGLWLSMQVQRAQMETLTAARCRLNKTPQQPQQLTLHPSGVGFRCDASMLMELRSPG